MRITEQAYRSTINAQPSWLADRRKNIRTMKAAVLFGLVVTGYLDDDGKWTVLYQCWHTGKIARHTFATFRDGLRCILDNMQFIPN